MNYTEGMFLEELIKVVTDTKEVIDRCMKKSLSVQKKGQGNFLTMADKEVEDFLKIELRKLIPESGFIGEESDSDYRNSINWIVDPIDGTTNFIYGYDYTVSVALQVNRKIVIGVVYVPNQKSVYFAQQGKGAYKKIYGEEAKKLYINKCMPDENEGIVIFGVPYDRKKITKVLDIIENIYPLVSDLKRIGPASLDLCMVAEGKAKLYVELDLEIWDISAGELIVSEAGGIVVQRDDVLLGGANCFVKKAIEAIKHL